MRSLKLSTSKISVFKQCRKKYFFKYIQEITLPSSEALEIGKNYHEQVSNILTNKLYEKTPMNEAFKKYIMPALPEIKETEKEFYIPLSYGTKLHGFFDAVTVDDVIVEHKTTKNSIDEKYIYRFNFNEQVSTYLLAFSIINKKFCNKMFHTAIQKLTIRQKQSETLEQYEQRCYEWYDESKAKVFPVVRTEKEVLSWQDEIIELSKEIKKCKNFYRNPSACMYLDCEYSSICQDYSGYVI